MQQTRRNLLRAGAGLLAGTSVAGCLDDLDLESATGGSGVQSSFYLLYDFARHVSDGGTEVESIVPFGQHGHGWEATGQVQRDVYDAAAFVYVGEGFQPWADNIVENLRSDDAGVTIVEAWEGIDMLPMDGDGHGGEHDGHDGEEDHEHDEHEHEEGEGDHHDEHEHEEGDHHDEHEEGEHDDEHDHGDLRGDPHFWLDPLRAKEAVANVRDGLIEADPDNEDRYAEQADEYAAELDGLHQTFESRLAGAETDHVFVAGHNSFRYLARRYGFEVHSIAGVSPDDEPSNRDVQEAQELIDEHGIEYVLHPALESDRYADQLVRETSAEEALPISAVSGVTEEWLEDDWGYVEIMENVNLPSLAKALGAT